MLFWLDLAAGASLLALAAAALGSSARYAGLAALAALAWFAGDLDNHLLLIHRPLVLYAALAYPDGRVPGRYARFLLAASWAGAVVLPLGRHAVFGLALGGLVVVEAWRRWADRAWVRRRVTAWSSPVLAGLAVSLGVPAAMRLWWPGLAGPDVLIAFYSGLIAMAGLVLLVGLLVRSPRRDAEAVIELSDRTPEQTLAALRREAIGRRGSTARAALDSAAALLEVNVALHAELAAKVDEVRASRTRLIDAAVSEQRRLERTLSDGALAYLAELARLLAAVRDRECGNARHLVAECLDEVAHLRDDLDQLAQGLHPRTLVDHGLAVALVELVERSPVPVSVNAPADRFPVAVETAVWYACTEALTNLAKHARAGRAAVDIRADGQELSATVRDDGVGGARTTPGGGLAGLVDRLGAVGGRLAVRPARGGGTEIEIRVPLG
jgi:signal transduction histidine kinase